MQRADAQFGPEGEQQLVLAIAPNETSTSGSLQLYHRDLSGVWREDLPRWRVQFGRAGLAWGRGLHDLQPGTQKVEGDGKSPAGRFWIGTIYGVEPALPYGFRDWPYHQLTDYDAWIENPNLPNYNRLVTVTPGQEPNWFEAQRMRNDDPAYRWLIFIEHNYPDTKLDAGSAIFFHIQRGDSVSTSGCTVMEYKSLMELMRWLDKKRKAQLVQLTRDDYLRLWRSWDLPPPNLVPPP